MTYVPLAYVPASAYASASGRYEQIPCRRCGRSGILRPEIALGLWQNFGDDRPLDIQRAIIRRAFDLGVTHFDLANNYGPPWFGYWHAQHTNDPHPWRVITRPSPASFRSARAAVLGAVPAASASSRTGGTRAPAGRAATSARR